MKKKFLIHIILSALILLTNGLKAQYNNLWIPDTLSGNTFNLNIKDTFSQIINTGQQTVTGGINGKFWGPTLIFNKGETVQMNVHNYLNETTTIHWHGMHLPAVMDGGPYQTIPPGTIWQPYWNVSNNAGTYWYHPHLHETTMEQITKGIGGLIIVRDAIESALALPRKYGIDDIPLVLTDRDFNTSNQFTVVPYGDSMMVNGTLRPQFTIPGQVVRFRILNAAIERSYNLGFSDNRSFYIITSDGGLLNAPVLINGTAPRYTLHAGERIEILVNCNGQSGTTVDLKAYNSTLANSIAGGESFATGPFGNYLGKKDFNILHLNIGAATSSPITTIPSTLTTNTLLNAANANITRSLTISDSTGVPGILGPSAFIINHKIFSLNNNDYQVPLNNTEIWEITSSSVFGHPFHIHDVEFNIISVNGVAPVAAQAGWKDVVFIPSKSGGPGGAPSVVKFIAKFDDFADSLHPFMYHCHISLHEDEGMMGQFIVKSLTTLPLSLLQFSATFANNLVLTNWTTTNETNTKYFVIERSNNSMDWASLDSLDAKNVSGKHDYSYTDSKPMFGTNYYRIKTIDQDGKKNYSDIRMIQTNDNAFEFNISPNPAKNRIYLNFNDPAYELYYIKLTDQIGRVKYMLPRPQIKNGIDVSHLSAGVYFLKVTDEKTKKTVSKKFVIQ